MLSAAIERAGLTDPLKVAYALEGLRIKTGMGETSLRPENHQLLEPLYMLSKVNADGVAEKYNVENTGFGDIGSVDAEGFVRIHDRMKDMINRGGYKVYSVEVENVMSHHPLVLESAVVPVPDPVLGEKVHAFVVRREGNLSVDDLRTFCAGHLSDYKVPDFFTLRDEPLPRNANGKILKRELRELALKTK